MAGEGGLLAAEQHAGLHAARSVVLGGWQGLSSSWALERMVLPEPHAVRRQSRLGCRGVILLLRFELLLACAFAVPKHLAATGRAVLAAALRIHVGLQAESILGTANSRLHAWPCPSWQVRPEQRVCLQIGQERTADEEKAESRTSRAA